MRQAFKTLHFNTPIQVLMRQIDPHTLYDSDELRTLLKGVVKIETLRAFGLVGSPGKGYWGTNMIDALNQYWDNLARQRDTGKVVGKENHLDEKPEFFENRAKKIQNGPVYSSPGDSQPMESQRKRFRRQVSPDSL